jgi:hypothetical protein
MKDERIDYLCKYFAYLKNDFVIFYFDETSFNVN